MVKSKIFLSKNIVPFLVLVLYFISCETGILDKIYYESIKGMRCEIIEMIKEEKIEIDGKDIIELKGKYKWATSDGTIMVFSEDLKEIAVGFWKMKGMLDSGFSMYVYVWDNKKMTVEELLGKKFAYINYEGCVIEEMEKNWFKVVVDSF